MNESPDIDVADPSMERLSRLERLCSQFEAAWTTGAPPRFAEYIDAVPIDERTCLLHELLSIDEYHRLQTGESPSDAEYIAQFPEHAETIRDYFAAKLATPLDVGADGATGRVLPTVPGYAIDRELGRGGMGVVYLAMQQRPRRHVALKMIRDGALAHPDVVRRFQTEADAIARLQHPNILQVYAVGEHDGRLYMALEYISGGGLDRRLDGKPMAFRDAATLIGQLASAVHYAHQQGVIHRDLKPANILVVGGQCPVVSEIQKPSSELTTDHWTLTTKIADFGLAKMLEGEVGTLTATGSAVGTPSYMAPEQARGEAAAIGPTTDVYALGAIFYQLLTGRPPFVGPNAVTTLEQVTSLDPVPPRQLQPQVPRDLDTICLKCLEKAPHKRYSSAAELAEDLRRCQAGEPIQARAVSAPERAMRWSRRHPAAAALIATLCVGLVLMVGLTIQLIVAQRNEHLAKVQTQDAVRKTLVLVSKDDQLTKKGLFELQLRVLSAIKEQAEILRGQSDDELLMAPELAVAYLQIATLQQHLGKLDNTGASLNIAQSLYETLASRFPNRVEYGIGVANCISARGQYFRRNFMISQALQEYSNAVAMVEILLQTDPNNESVIRLLVAARLGWGEVEAYVARRKQDIEERSRRLAGAVEQLRIGLAECTRRQFKDDAMRLMEAKLNMGIADALIGNDLRSSDAVEFVRNSTRIASELSVQELDDMPLCGELAEFCSDLGRVARLCRLYPEAKSSFDIAIDKSEKLCQAIPTAQNYSLALAMAYLRLGNVVRHLGQFDDERKFREKSIGQVEQLVRAGRVTVSHRTRDNVTVVYRNHIQYLLRLGNIEAAKKISARSQEVHKLIWGSDTLELLRDTASGSETPQEVYDDRNRTWDSIVLKDRAQILEAEKKYSESSEAWKQSLEMHKANTTQKLVGLSLALAGAGRCDEAMQAAEKVASANDFLPEDWYDLARAYARCSVAEAPTVEQEQRKSAAIKYLRKGLDNGFFDPPDTVALLKSDPDLEPLRGCMEFAALVMAVNEAKAER